MNDRQLQAFQLFWSGLPEGIRVVIIVLVGAWTVLYPAGWLVAGFMRGRKAQLEKATQGANQFAAPQRGFSDGGAAIGRLERLLIYLFVLSGNPGAVGFLIAAKSIFRFGELSDHANRLEAEYITIGTLMSFAVGFAVSIAMLKLIAAVAVAS